MSAAELSIGRRIAGATRDDVQRALWVDRTLVKTFGPRGTVHLLAATDLPMWTGALSTLPSSVPIHPEPVRFAPAEADEVIAAIGESLAESELTVDELTEAIRERTGDWAVERTMDAFQDKWPRWRLLTSTAAHRGVLCFGPDRGRNVTYTSPQRWLPGFRPLDGATALRALLARYLHAFGPATPEHMARWLAIPRASAQELFDDSGRRARAGRGRRRIGVDSRRRYGDAGHIAPRRAAAPVLRCLRRRPASHERGYSRARRPRGR